MRQWTISKKWRNVCWLLLVLAMAGLLAASVGSSMGEAGRLWLLGGTVTLAASIVLLVVCGRKLRCPSCGRVVDREAVQAFRRDHISCPQCGRKLTLE